MPNFLGVFLSFLGEFNLFIFGDFAKIYPFLCLFLNYLFYKRGYELDKVKTREINALIVAFVSLMILFGILSKNAGYVPEILYTVIGAIFGRVGSGILSLLSLLLSCVVLMPRFFEIVLGVKISFEFLEKIELKFKTFLDKIFAGKIKETQNTNKQEETKEDSFEKILNKQEENKILNENEQNPVTNIVENRNQKLVIIEEMQEQDDKNIEPKEQDIEVEQELETQETQINLEDDKNFDTQNEELKNFVLKASAEIDEYINNTKKQEVYVPTKFLKPKKIDEIKLNLAKRLNYEEPSYLRKQVKNDEVFEDEKNTKSEEEQILAFTVDEKKQEDKKSVFESEFMPIVEELETDKKDLHSQKEPIPFVEEVKEALKPDISKDFFKKNTEHISKNFTIKKELSSNTELLNEIEKGELAKPKDFTLPPLDFLANPLNSNFEVNEQEIDKKIYDLLEKLRRFKIGGDVISTYTGPVVTTFEFRPSADVKVSRILNLQDDLAMALKATSIRIQAPIPGKDVVGIEVPNDQIQTIYLKEILQSKAFTTAKSPLTMALGKDIVGNAFVTDLKKLPHLLIAGTTGSGKSVGINSMLLSLLYRNSPKNLKLMMIDPKMLEFSIYNDIPHLLTPVITEPKKAIIALSNMVAEMERRYKLMAEAKTKNIENYNEKMKELGNEELPFIVVIIDELADLMMSAGKDVEFYIARLAQMARASGIHLIVATQRPSVDVVTGLIKANLPSRLAYKVGQKIDSKVILDTVGAESLLGRGDCLFTPPSSNNLVRLHAPFASESEIEKIVEFLKAQQDVIYDEHFLKDTQSSNTESIQTLGETDDLFEEAKAVILEDRKTSISYLQRRLKIGYNRAANIIEQLSDAGFLSQPDSKGQREIL